MIPYELCKASPCFYHASRLRGKPQTKTRGRPRLIRETDGQSIHLHGRGGFGRLVPNIVRKASQA